VEASSFGDLTSDKYVDIQKRIDAAIQTVNPAEEYREFTEKHRSSSALPVIFRFDDQLIEDTVGKLQANQLTVDNLTVDNLRQRMVDLENSVKECQEKQIKLQSESNGKISSSASSLPTTPTSIIQNNSLNGSLNGSNGSLKDVK
jgi:tyrosine-protein kinase Fer